MNKISKQKIAFIGQRYYPSNHRGSSGVEYYVGQKIQSFISNNRIICYTSDPKQSRKKGGVEIIYIPSIPLKHFDTPVRAILATIHALCIRPDVVWYQGCQSGICIPVLRLCKIKTILVIHSDEYKKAKWGRVSSLVLRIAERVAVSSANTVVSVSSHTKKRLEKMYHKKCILDLITMTQIKYTITRKDVPVAARSGIPYILFLGRFVPEKRIHWLIAAFQQSRLRLTHVLILAGEESHSKKYAASLFAMAHNEGHIKFLPYQTGKAKLALLKYCTLFVLPSDVEGYPVALLEALTFKTRCLAPDVLIGENFPSRSTLHYFHTNSFRDFKNQLLTLINTPLKMGR